MAYLYITSEVKKMIFNSIIGGGGAQGINIGTSTNPTLSFRNLVFSNVTEQPLFFLAVYTGNPWDSGEIGWTQSTNWIFCAYGTLSAPQASVIQWQSSINLIVFGETTNYSSLGITATYNATAKTLSLRPNTLSDWPSNSQIISRIKLYYITE